MTTNPRYLTPRSAYFFRRIRQELVQDVLGQSVIIYPIIGSFNTGDKYARLHKENSLKKYGNGKRIPAVSISLQAKQEVLLDDALFDTSTSMQVGFDRETLKEYGFMINIGDIIVFQNLIFEVSNVDDTSMLQGSPQYKYKLVVDTIRARISIKDLPFMKDNPL